MPLESWIWFGMNFLCFELGTLYMFLTDPVGNGTVKDKRLDPTPVDQLLAVSCSVLEINVKLLCSAQLFPC